MKLQRGPIPFSTSLTCDTSPVKVCIRTPKSQINFQDHFSHPDISMSADTLGPIDLDEEVQLLNSIASDLDLMLNDICGGFPYPSAITQQSTGPVPDRSIASATRAIHRETSVFEDYITRSVEKDDDTDTVTSYNDDTGRLRSCDDVFADESESASSDSEFFSLDEDEVSDTAVVVSGGSISPPPLPPPPTGPPTARRLGARNDRLRRVSRPVSQPLLPQDKHHNVLNGSTPPEGVKVQGCMVESPAGLGASGRESLYGRNISTYERLVQTHAVWYLPSIGRVGAVHLLHDREEGVFLVRQASQAENLALSVRVGRRPNIEHFLLERSSSGVRVGDSKLWFSSIPALCAHYVHRKDDLPTKLVLPVAISEAKTNQELASLALLCQDFWTSPISLKQPVVRSVFRTSINNNNNYSENNNTRGDRERSQRPSSFRHSSVIHHKPPVTSRMSSTARVTSLDQSAVSHSINLPVTTPAAQQILGVVNGDGRDAGEQVTSSQNNARSSVIRNSDVSRKNSSKRVSSQSNGVSVYAWNRESYNKARLEDRLSDYEDVWNNSRSSSAGVTNPFFRPIQNGSQSDDSTSTTEVSPRRRKPKLTRTKSKKKQMKTVSKVVPNTDSETDGSVRAEKPSPRKCPRLTSSTKQLSEVQVKPQRASNVADISSQRERDTSSTNVSRKNSSSTPVQEPIVFTFDFDGMTIAPTSEIDLHKPTTADQISPSYAQPYDTLIGKLEGISETLGTIRVSNALKKNQYKSEIALPTSSKTSFECDFKSGTYTSKLHTHVSSKNKTQYDEPKWTTGEIVSTLPRGGFKLRAATKNNLAPLPTGYQVPHDSMDRPKLMNRSHSMQCLGAAGLGTAGQTVTSQYHTTTKVVPGKPPLPSQSMSMNNDAVEKANINNGHFATSPRQRSEIKAYINSTNAQSLETFLKPVQNVENSSKSSLQKFPNENRASVCSQQTGSDASTVEDLIHDVSPDLTLKPIKPLTLKNLQRMSDYDNLSGITEGKCASRRTAASSTDTNYCVPWDSSMWQEIVAKGLQGQVPPHIQAAYRNSAHLHPRHSQVYSNYDTSSLADNASLYEPESSRPQSEVIHSDLVIPTYEPAVGEKRETIDSATETTPGFGGDEVLVLPGKVESSFLQEQLAEMEEQMVKLAKVSSVSDDEGVEEDEVTDEGHSEDEQQKLKPLLTTPRLLSVHAQSNASGAKVRDVVSSLATNSKTTFGKQVDFFVKCTIEGSETNPQTVVRNVRQFMNGIKNYLVKHGESEFQDMIEKERSLLGADQFLNVDAIVEGALHRCIVKPLKQHIYKLFVDQYKRNGNLQKLSDNIKYARTKTPYELGIKPNISTPQPACMEVIKHFLDKMQKSYSPLEKVENLLGATTAIYNSIQNGSHTSGPRKSTTDSKRLSATSAALGADDFLPMFIYVLVQCGMVSAEIEADYIWALLHPSLLSGEAGYHLTTFSSAVHVLKNIKSTMEMAVDKGVPRLPSMGDMNGFMKIIIPDEKHDSIITKTLPVRPNTSSREVCSMIAHKFNITNPQEHGLYVVLGGVEDRLGATTCPQSVKEEIQKSGKDCVFAYKRINAKFAWPCNFKT